MEGKIDKFGDFYIKRAGRWEEIKCPESSGSFYGGCRCGGWCPRFEEITIQRYAEIFDPKTKITKCGTYDFPAVKTCGATVEIVEDERGGE